LPVVSGHYTKDKFGLGIVSKDQDGPKVIGAMVHGSAAMDCLIQADRWLEKYAPHELATVVHEDGAATKVLIKRAVSMLRNPALHGGLSEEACRELGIPLKRIIDTVHFADKEDARPLQLADLCAFVMGRALKDMPVPAHAFQVIWKHLKWRHKAIAPPNPALSSEEEPS
jgi:hypothetical protein